MRKLLLCLAVGGLYFLISLEPVQRVFTSETLSIVLWTIVGLLVAMSIGTGLYFEVKKRTGKG